MIVIFTAYILELAQNFRSVCTSVFVTTIQETTGQLLYMYFEILEEFNFEKFITNWDVSTNWVVTEHIDLHTYMKIAERVEAELSMRLVGFSLLPT